MVFEFLNIPVQNWNYMGVENLGIYRDLVVYFSFATVLPALFETFELLKSLNIFKNKKLRKGGKINENMLHFMMALGVACFILPVLFPTVAYPLIWGSFFLLLDPINYINKQPSIIGHLKNGNRVIVYYLFLTGIILGFLWEFWNYWAEIKWIYEIPFVGFFKLFEMPILGYIGYFPFALELYAMYWFTRSLFLRKDHWISD